MPQKQQPGHSLGLWQTLWLPWALQQEEQAKGVDFVTQFEKDQVIFWNPGMICEARRVCLFFPVGGGVGLSFSLFRGKPCGGDAEEAGIEDSAQEVMGPDP